MSGFLAENILPLPAQLKADLRGKPHSHVAATIRDYWGGMQAE